MEVSSNVFLAIVLGIVLPYGALALYTMRKIKRFPMPDVQKNSWQLIVYTLPIVGLVAWYAFEFRGSKEGGEVPPGPVR